jgi:hypothetical protein
METFGYKKTGGGPVAAFGTIYARIPGYGPQAPQISIDTDIEGQMGIGQQFLKASELDPQYEADYAATDVQNKFERQMGADNRRLSAMGIDPSSGKARAINRNAGVALAAAKAGAANTGRRKAKEVNREWRFKAAQLMQRDKDMAWQREKYALDQMNKYNQDLANASKPTYLSKGRSSFQRAQDRGAVGKGMNEQAWKAQRHKDRHGVGGKTLGNKLTKEGPFQHYSYDNKNKSWSRDRNKHSGDIYRDTTGVVGSRQNYMNQALKGLDAKSAQAKTTGQYINTRPTGTDGRGVVYPTGQMNNRVLTGREAKHFMPTDSYDPSMGTDEGHIYNYRTGEWEQKYDQQGNFRGASRDYQQNYEYDI